MGRDTTARERTTHGDEASAARFLVLGEDSNNPYAIVTGETPIDAADPAPGP